jgi:hypothetical protein
MGGERGTTLAGRGRSEPGLSGRACCAALVVGGLLVFCWPFVRSPPLSLLGSYLHLLGAWAALIAGIALTARALGNDGAGPDA